jgi:TonB family protein
MYIKLNNSKKNLKGSRKKTTTIVVAIHVVILFIVFLAFAIDSLFEPKKINSINVTIVNSSDYQQNKVSSEKIAPVKPKTVKKKKPVIKKKTVKPKPKPKPKKTWKALDPSQIIKSTTQVKRNKKPQKKIKYKPLKASDIAAKLRSNLKNINFKSTNNVSPSILNYYDKIISYLASRWEQPSRAAVGNRNPSVLIRISVNSRGKILSAKIVQKSGISVMDRSIMKLLSNLSTLPKPPEGATTFEVNMVLED